MSAGKPERRKVNFVLLKQILDDGESEISTDEGDNETVISNYSKSTEDEYKATHKEIKEKKSKASDNSGPVGRYPVVFSKRCRSKTKSCQTRLSAFPLFPVPEETEWISDGEESSRITRSPRRTLEKRIRMRQKQSEDFTKNTTAKGNITPKSVKKKTKSKDVKTESEILETVTRKTKNSDGSRKEFASEHQLKETENPILRAWIHQKNKLTRKKQREERKERRAKRIALQEEQRIKDERRVESEKSVRQWLKHKKKEATVAWRRSHPKVNPFDMGETAPGTPVPPPEYTVVKSFTCTQPSPSVATSGSVSGSNVNLAQSTRDTVSDCQPSEGKKRTKSRNKVIVVQPKNDDKGQNLAPQKGVRQRPKSAVSNLDHKGNVSESPNRTATQRPQTVKGKPSRPRTARSRGSTEDSTAGMQSMNYDEWLKFKRDQDKKHVIQKKREIIDEHLDAVVAELGKQRVDRILSPRKQVNTGLKHYKRSPERTTKTPTVTRKDNPYRWVPVLDQKSPRPEPQGCDCPTSDHPNMENESNNLSTPETGQVGEGGSTSPTTRKKQAVTFCQEITDQCNTLKPSMDKVLAVLDSEIKTSTEKKATRAESAPSKTNAVAGSQVTLESDLASDSDHKAVNSSGRPRSARPKSARVSNTSLTAEEVRKKILGDMDILGLCESEKMSSSSSEENVDTRTTVRQNYFDYGSGVDPSTMQSVTMSSTQ